jgi:hypothetical protein
VSFRGARRAREREKLPVLTFKDAVARQGLAPAVALVATEEMAEVEGGQINHESRGGPLILEPRADAKGE